MIFPIAFLLAALIALTIAIMSIRMDKEITYFYMAILFIIMMVISLMIVGIHTMLTN